MASHGRLTLTRSRRFLLFYLVNLLNYFVNQNPLEFQKIKIYIDRDKTTLVNALIRIITSEINIDRNESTCIHATLQVSIIERKQYFFSHFHTNSQCCRPLPFSRAPKEVFLFSR